MNTGHRSTNPFPGLRAFTQEEDYLFFGREEQSIELLQRLGSNRFVTVVGTSGSGKSSLVRCGLLSELLGGKMRQAGASWEVAVTHPGGNPLALLTDALLEADLYDIEEENARENLLATLSRSHFGLVEAVKQSDLGTGTNFLVVVDQFEELFRCRGAGETQREAAAEFVSLLLETVAQSEVPIYVVLTMRSDFIGECSQFDGLAELVNRGEFLIPRLTREQYKRVIDGPIKVAGGQIAPRLLQRLLNDLGQQADQLPCLQHALMRTWDVWAAAGDSEALDLDDYQRVGKMAEALSLHADEIYHALPGDQEREWCRGIFEALTVKESESRGIRRPQRLSALGEILEVPVEQLIPIIDAYRQQGVTFLMPSPEIQLTGDTIIDISHESLMRVWKRLRNWVEEEAQAAGIYRRLQETAELHAKGQAGLYSDPDLQIAQSWREQSQPNQAWAEQYAGAFNETVAFLDESENAARQAEREQEEARIKELEQARELAAQSRVLAEAQRSAARNFKRFAIGMGIVALLALGAFVFAFTQQKNAERAEVEANNLTTLAERLEKEAVEKEKQTSHEFAQSDVSISRSFTEKGDVGRGIAHLVRSLEREPGQPVVVDRIFNLLAYTAPPGYLSPSLDYGEDYVYATTASPDGSVVATATKGGLKVWSPGSDRPSYQEDFYQQHNLDPSAGAIWHGGLVLSSDDRLLFVAINNARNAPALLSHLVDLTSGEKRWEVAPSAPPRMRLVYPRFSRDEKQIFTIAFTSPNKQMQVVVLDSADGTKKDDGMNLAFMLSPDGTKKVFRDSEEGFIRLVGASGASPVESHFKISKDWDGDFCPDGERILVGETSLGARTVYETETGKELFSLGDPNAELALPDAGDRYAGESASSQWAFTPDGQFILSVGTDRIVRLWDASNETPGTRLLAEEEILRNVLLSHSYVNNHMTANKRTISFSADGRRFMIATRDGGCYHGEFDQAEPRVLPKLKRSAHVNDGYAFLADKGTIKPLLLPHRDVVAAAVAPDGASLALGSNDGRVAVYDLVTGERHGSGFAPGGTIRSVAFSRDGNRLAAASGLERVVVWDLAKARPVGPPIALPESAEREIESLGFTDDGSGLVIQTEREKLTEESRTVISVYDIETGTRRGSHRISSPFGNDISLDRSTLLQAWEDFLQVSDIETGKIRASIIIPEGVESAALSADGSLIAAILSDSSLRLWSTHSGKAIELGHRADFPEAEKLRFSEDKQMLAVWGFRTVTALPLVSGSSPVQMALPDSVQVRSLALSGDGRLVAAVVAEGEETYGWVWDSSSGAPISDRLAFSRSVNSVTFLQGGRQAVFWPQSPSAGDEPGLATLWDVSVSGGNASPDWFRALATSMGGMRLGEKGQVQPVIAEERLALPDVLAEIDEESPLAKFGRWLLEYPGTRSDSPFRPVPSEAYVQSLIEEADFALLDEVVRLIPRSHAANARAHARRAALRLVEDEPSPATLALCRADLARARLLEPNDIEIAWYHWMTLAKIGDPTKAQDALARALGLGDPDGDQILSLIRVHEQLDVGGKEIIEMLTRALAKGSDEHALGLRIKRFELAAGAGDLTRVQEDWAILAGELALPAPYDSSQLLNTYFDAVYDEAQRLHSIGELDAAVDSLLSVALAREVIQAAYEDASRVSWLFEAIQWAAGTPLIAKKSEWSYNDQGVDLGEAWREPEYVEEDGAWKTGRGIFGYGDDDDGVERTKVNWGPDEENKHTTTYFRHEFTVAPGILARFMDVEVLRDDGVIVYLNGKEILRQNMPTGEVDWKDFALGSVPKEDEHFYFSAKGMFDELRPGKNVIAAEIHQSSLGSSDLGFDLGLIAYQHSPLDFLMESLAADVGALEAEALKAVPVAHRKRWKRDFDLLMSGKIEGSTKAVPEGLWQRRYDLWSGAEAEQTLKLIDARLATLDYSPEAAKRRIAWLWRKEAVLARLPGQAEEIEAVKQAIRAGPPRDPNSSPKLIDLSKYYTGSLYDTRYWTNKGNEHPLSTLPETFVPRNGVGFDLRGVVMLNSGIYPLDQGAKVAGKDIAQTVGRPLPDEQNGIKIGQKSKALHFLMSSNWGRERPGVEVARFVMHYDDGTSRTMSVDFGEHIVDWWNGPDNSPIESSQVGWHESRPGVPRAILSELVWTNPHPDKTISHIDFISNLKLAAPFLVGITLE